jgi:hypothetical protein
VLHRTARLAGTQENLTDFASEPILAIGEADGCEISVPAMLEAERFGQAALGEKRTAHWRSS